MNVERPTGVRAGRSLPVYVFIHGGGLVNGSSSQADGDKIVRESGAIYVSLNARAMMQSGSCFSRTVEQTETNSATYAPASGSCPAA